jgi:hypothetical protein
MMYEAGFANNMITFSHFILFKQVPNTVVNTILRQSPKCLSWFWSVSRVHLYWIQNHAPCARWMQGKFHNSSILIAEYKITEIFIVLIRRFMKQKLYVEYWLVLVVHRVYTSQL